MLSGKLGEIADTMKSSCIDICCLHEVSWRGKSAKMVDIQYKLLWSGRSKPENGVGEIAAN